MKPVSCILWLDAGLRFEVTFFDLSCPWPCFFKYFIVEKAGFMK
jgi:hypothetical protein